MEGNSQELLDPGEKLIWAGAPSADRLLMRIDYLLVPAGAVLGIIAFVGFFTELKNVTGGDSGAWPLVALCALGLWAAWRMVLGHFIRRRRVARSTAYVLSDRRLISVRARRGGGRSTSEVLLADRPAVRVRPQYEGRATITVGRIKLFNIPDATRVETLIRQYA